MLRLVLRKQSTSLTSMEKFFAHPHSYVEMGVSDLIILVVYCYCVFIHF